MGRAGGRGEEEGKDAAAAPPTWPAAVTVSMGISASIIAFSLSLLSLSLASFLLFVLFLWRPLTYHVNLYLDC